MLLRPSRVTNQNAAYCLALAAEKTGVLIHAVCVMSNHWHGVVTDPEARLPEFLEAFHRLLAKVQNAAIGRWENLWSSDKPHILELADEQTILEKMAYTLANPTLARLVKSPAEWPGLISRRIREKWVVEMPDIYFDEDGDLPESAELRVQPPPIHVERSEAELQRALDTAVSKLVKRTQDEVREQGSSFLGRANVLRQSFDTTPNSEAPRRNFTPRVAGKSPEVRELALTALAKFIGSYRATRNDWQNGNRSAIFPAGTYALRLFAGVQCYPPAPA